MRPGIFAGLRCVVGIEGDADLHSRLIRTLAEPIHQNWSQASPTDSLAAEMITPGRGLGEQMPRSVTMVGRRPYRVFLFILCAKPR